MKKLRLFKPKLPDRPLDNQGSDGLTQYALTRILEGRSKRWLHRIIGRQDHAEAVMVGELAVELMELRDEEARVSLVLLDERGKIILRQPNIWLRVGGTATYRSRADALMAVKTRFW